MHVRFVRWVHATSALTRTERRSQKSSKRPLSLQQRRAMIALAPPDGPVHPGTLEAGADGHLAARFHDTGRRAEPLGPKLGVAHAIAIPFDVIHARPGLVVCCGVGV